MLASPAVAAEVQYFNVPQGDHPHDVAPAPDGTVWYTGQRAGVLGRLDPNTGQVERIPLGQGSAPHGVIIGPDGAIYYVSLAGSFLGKPDLDSGETSVIEPQTPKAGTRRVWSDSKGRLWVSEWNAGNLSVYDPASQTWEVYKLPGDSPHAYAVYVDGKDKVWVSDFGANAILQFDPETKNFASFPSDMPDAAVRQLNGRQGEVWGAESATDRLVVIRTGEKQAKD
jgi:virginiamycin B lyase